MSISFRLRPATLFVAGALLVPSAAFAQDPLVPIVPTVNPVAPVPAPVASPPAAPTDKQSLLDMTFRDVEVTRLLDILSTEFELPIAINGDVSGKLSSINLKGKTPEQALAVIVRTAQLSMEKTEDGTYIISKLAPAPIPDAVTPTAPLPVFNNPITPSQGNSVMLQPFGTPVRQSPTADISMMDDAPALVDVSSVGGKEDTFNIPIRNVKASLMAFWLDPANHEAPIDVTLAKTLERKYYDKPLVTSVVGGSSLSSGPQFSSQGLPVQPFDTGGVVPSAGNPYLNSNSEMIETRSNAQFQNNGGGGGGRNGNGGNGGNNNGRGGRGGNGNGNGGGVFQLPEGVTRIVAVDPQNALLVFGTPEGAQKLANTIRFLDRPLRQVEIEAQFLSISTSDSKTYGFDFSTSRGNFNGASTGSATTTPAGGLQLGFFRGNFQAAIAASVGQGKAKILTAPRVTAINNLTASLQQTTSTPIVLTTTNTVANNAIAQSTSQQVFYVTTTIGLQVTPTINNDDTVTVLMQPVLQTQGTPNSLGASAITSQQLQTIANVRDGETIALGGLRTTNVTIDKTKIPLIGDIPVIGSLFRSRTNRATEAELIIFLTARIIRRAGDEDAVGTGIGAADVPIGVGP